MGGKFNGSRHYTVSILGRACIGVKRYVVYNYKAKKMRISLLWGR